MFLGVECPGGRMIDPPGCALDVGVIRRRDSPLEIVGILPEVVPEPRAEGEARRIERFREPPGEFGNSFRVVPEGVGQTVLVPGMGQGGGHVR